MTRNKEAGQALIAALAALGIVLLGFAGLGIDIGYMRYEKRLQQTAADAAAIAGAATTLRQVASPPAQRLVAAAKMDLQMARTT